MPLSSVQSQIDALTSTGRLSSRQDVVGFFDRARKLLTTHEGQLTKDHLTTLLTTVQELGPLLNAPQIQVFTSQTRQI